MFVDTRKQADENGFDGVVTVQVAGKRVRVRAILRGHFEPIDGRYHWWGRLAANEELRDLVPKNAGTVLLSTPEGNAYTSLSDPDFWGRYRVSGTGKPPFAVGAPAALG